MFVLWSALFLASNIFQYKDVGQTLFGTLQSVYREGGLISAFATAIAFTIFLPIILIATFFGLFADDASEKADHRRQIKDILQNFLLILAVFVVILFINWQLKKFT